MTEHSFQGSSTVESAVYDEEARELTVQFVKGNRYRYYDVEPGTADRFFTAGSPGRFVAEELSSYSYGQV